MKLINLDWFPLEKTFFALVFDAAFYYDVATNEKDDIENAYTDWLLSKAYAANVQNIYMAGASRGGCLMVRIAKNIRDQYSWDGADIFVSGFDAVANAGRGELNGEKVKLYNPLNASYYAWTVHLADYFNHTDGLSIFQLAGGSNVSWGDNLVGNPHGFAMTDSEDSSASWYEQTWINHSHTTIGRSYDTHVVDDTVDAQLNWLRRKLLLTPISAPQL